MNRQRRAELSRIGQELWALAEAMEACADGERKAYDNMPENLQQSDRAEKLDASATELEEIHSELMDLAQRAEDAAAAAY